MDYEDVSPGVAVLATQHRHVSFLRETLMRIRHELERRAERHDRSKLGPTELPGFSRISAMARSHPYGSDEYKASLAAEGGTVARHYAENSHHPEHHGRAVDMGWLDIIEMVCDWHAAGATYGKSGSLRDTLPAHKERFDFTAAQWWLIEEVATYLEGVS